MTCERLDKPYTAGCPESAASEAFSVGRHIRRRVARQAQLLSERAPEMGLMLPLSESSPKKRVSESEMGGISCWQPRMDRAIGRSSDV